MIAMSSTAIIYKAFDDLGLRKKQFTGLVLSILILEDILAVLLMVILSTIAVSNSFQGGELLMSIGKLLFFIILWFVVGLYLIPQLLRKTRNLMNDETSGRGPGPVLRHGRRRGKTGLFRGFRRLHHGVHPGGNH